MEIVWSDIVFFGLLLKINSGGMLANNSRKCWIKPNYANSRGEDEMANSSWKCHTWPNIDAVACRNYLFIQFVRAIDSDSKQGTHELNAMKLHWLNTVITEKVSISSKSRYFDVNIIICKCIKKYPVPFATLQLSDSLSIFFSSPWKYCRSRLMCQSAASTETIIICLYTNAMANRAQSLFHRALR